LVAQVRWRRRATNRPAAAAARSQVLAWTQLWQGRFDAAERSIDGARSDERWLGQPRNLRIFDPHVRVRAQARCAGRSRGPPASVASR
jgi:hypothetical protein